MDKGKRNSLTPKGPNGQGITPKSSLKKRDSIGNGEEKKVRFTGKLVPEHTPTAKTTPKILVKEVVDSDDDTTVTPSGKQILKKVTTPSQLTNKQKLQVQNVKPSPQSVPIKKNGNVPQSRKRKASDSDDESSEDDDDKDDDSDDDSDLAALWDESEDDSELDIMEDFFEEDDSEDEKPSTVVIEEVKDDKKRPEPKATKTETSLTDSKLARKPSVKRRADHDLEPPAKRLAPVATVQTVSPAKKPKTEDANNNNNKGSLQNALVTDKSKMPKEKKAKQAAVPSSNRKSIKKSVNERLAPYQGKCSPEEYKKLKKKFQAQERKRRSRLEKLHKATSLKNVPADDREALIKLSDERMDELRKRVLYVRHIPTKINAAMLKKALPTITGCRIPPKLESKKVKGKKNVQGECIVYGRARGYAFLEFASAEEAKRQLAQLQGRKEPLIARNSSESGQPLQVRLGEERASEKRTAKTRKSAAKEQSSAAKRAKRCDFMTLHVGGLPCHAQLSQMKEFLQCDRVDMPVVADGNLGFCMAHYNRVEDAVKIFREKHGVVYHGCKLWIAFSLKSSTKKVK